MSGRTPRTRVAAATGARDHAATIERIALGELHADPANARSHSARNVEVIKASLARFGQQRPVVIDSSNVVRAGNGVLEAARALGWTHLYCVRTRLEGSEATAYAIADNRASELSGWDDDALAATLESLRDFNPELLEATGFDADELQRLLMRFTPEATGADARLDAKAPVTCPECGHEFTP